MALLSDTTRGRGWITFGTRAIQGIHDHCVGLPSVETVFSKHILLLSAETERSLKQASECEKSI